MGLVFMLSEEYRKNIKGFKGNYLFTTNGNGVDVSAMFDDGDMKVSHQAISNWNVKITFESHVALMEFLLSQDQDILNSILENEVQVEGNLNYIYRFGFLAKDLERRVTDQIFGPFYRIGYWFRGLFK